MSDDEDSLFEEGGETPVARAVKLLKTSPGADFRSAKIQSTIKKLQGAKDFLRDTVLVLETMIAGLQVDIIKHGTRAEQESFQSSKLHWESVINKHKRKFGERARPFRHGAHKTGSRKGSGRLYKDILTTGESITVREEKGITTKRAQRDELMRQRRISEERRQLGPQTIQSAEGALVSAAFGRTVSRGSGLSEQAPARPGYSPMRDDPPQAGPPAVVRANVPSLSEEARTFIADSLRDVGGARNVQRF